MTCKFSERLQQTRIKNNERQEDLAGKLNVNRATIIRYENGHSPQVPMLNKIAEHYNVSLDYLCGITDIEKPLKKDINNSMLENVNMIIKAANDILKKYEINQKKTYCCLNNNKPSTQKLT